MALLTALSTALSCVLALVSCTASDSRESVTVLGPWEKDSEDGRTFQSIIDDFEQRHPRIRVQYTGTRDADAVLASELGSSHPPDLAVLATPGRLRQYARTGVLVPLDTALDLRQMGTQYDPQWRDIMRTEGKSGKEQYFAVLVKAAAKSLIWYNTRTLPTQVAATLTSPSLTWEQVSAVATELARTGTPWCMGLEDSSNSGWPGTDWIEDIVLHQSGPKVYDEWISGAITWKSPKIKQAWSTFGELVGKPGMVSGDTRTRLRTKYSDSGKPLFSSDPGCYLDHAGSFVTGIYSGYESHPRAGADFDFVPFPRFAGGPGAAQEVGGDLLGMFRDTPAARQFIGYLTTPAAQRKWIERPGSGAISVNLSEKVLDAYPDSLSKRLAATLTDKSTTVRFDASDSMSPVMSDAFNHAVLRYLESPDQLDAILAALDRVRTAES